MADTNKLTLFTVIFMLTKILSGVVIHSCASLDVVTAWAGNITLPTDIFLHLIRMVIAPLILSTLTVGTICLGETSTTGHAGDRVMIRFISSSILFILIGLSVVSLGQPGSGLNLAIPLEAADTGLAMGSMSLKDFLTHTISTNIAEATTNDEILQTVVFSMLFGTGGVSFREKFDAPLVVTPDVISHIMLKVTGYVVYAAPPATFAAISSIISTQGLGILLSYALPVGGYYVVILLTCLALLAVEYATLKKEVFRPVSMLKGPALVAFTTSSFETAYLKTLKQSTKSGCSPNIVSFVLPIGYLSNLVGSMICRSFASMFITQACNIYLSFAGITILMLTLMLVSKGIAGVPRSALVVLVVTIPSFSIPITGILLLIRIDHFLNMGRPVINVLGNGIATAMLAQDGGLLEEKPELAGREAQKRNLPDAPRSSGLQQ